MGDSLCSWFDDPEFGDGDELFSILESLEEVTGPNPLLTTSDHVSGGDELAAEQKTGQAAASRSPFHVDADEAEDGGSPAGNKRRKVEEGGLREERVSHITVERNRRKQMNEHLSVLRSLMPCFYVKRGDQASIIDGVVSYISELQQILQSLEAKKQRRAYNDVLSPRLSGSSPRPSPQSPRNQCISPRLNLPMCPRTPQPGSPYRTKLPPPLPPSPPPSAHLSPTLAKSPLDPSPCSSSTSSIDTSNKLVANSKSSIAEVEVKFSGPNLVLKTKSPKIAGQVAKIVSALDGLSMEILQLNINAIEDTLLISFTIKIGIECQLSAEELALQIQQTFCYKS